MTQLSESQYEAIKGCGVSGRSSMDILRTTIQVVLEQGAYYKRFSWLGTVYEFDTIEDFFDGWVGISYQKMLGFFADEPEKLEALKRAKTKEFDIEVRRNEVKRLHELKFSQSEIAEQLGVSQPTVNADLQLSENPVRTEKTDKPKRTLVRYEINSGTKPEVAAAKIREKFGDAYADELKNLL